jgi:SpoVK/Ycf46/Vps4 family AAA+-type ATPase
MFQFMTPSMLPKLRSLREKGSSVFFISTNYQERIDSAAIRPGRIDKLLLVGPPDSDARSKLIQARISGLKSTKPHISQTSLAVYNEVVQYCEQVVSGVAKPKLTPTIQLRTYANRFEETANDDAKKRIGREPWVEFCYLVEMLVNDQGKTVEIVLQENGLTALAKKCKIIIASHKKK